MGPATSDSCNARDCHCRSDVGDVCQCESCSCQGDGVTGDNGGGGNEERLLSLLERIALALEQQNWIKITNAPPAKNPWDPPFTVGDPLPYTQPWDGSGTAIPFPYTVRYENTCKVTVG